MPADYTNLNQAVADAVTQADASITTEAGATVLINSFSTKIQEAVTKALTDDNAADQGSIDAAMAAIKTVTARYNASAADLGAAVANVPA